MLRALPAMVRTAASRSAAVRSGIFAFAISSSCLRVILPTFVVFGVPLPFSMPIALRISTDAGGVFMMKVKLRSLYTVMTTGIGRPFSTLLRLRVELLAELHDVDALLAERRPDRRARVRLACRHLQLDVTVYFLSHLASPLGVQAPSRAPRCQAFSTWPKSSSTGVERPRICTATCRRLFS